MRRNSVLPVATQVGFRTSTVSAQLRTEDIGKRWATTPERWIVLACAAWMRHLAVA